MATVLIDPVPTEGDRDAGSGGTSGTPSSTKPPLTLGVTRRSRLIDAPRELVFEAFTEVRHLPQWWGPEGFTTTTRAFEFPTTQLRDEAVEEYHAYEGGQQTLSNLAAYVTEVVRKGGATGTLQQTTTSGAGSRA